MAFFSYRGRNARGDLVQGYLEGTDVGAIADQLTSTGVIPVDIQAASALPAGSASAWWRRVSAPHIATPDLMLFSRQMYTLLKAGVPILRALAGLQESTPNLSLVAVIQDLRASLDAGRELSSALRRHAGVFSPFYVSLVRVGEMTGRLEEVFLRLAQHLEFEKDMRDRVKSALRYPMIVITALAGAIILINVLVIPVFAKVFEGFKAELPLPTRIIIGFSNFTVQYWWLIFAVAFACFATFRAWIATPAGRLAWDRLKLRIPISGKIIEKATLARFSRSFALSVKSGVPVVQAFTVVSEVVENDYIGRRIVAMREGVERGESVLRTASAAGVFTPVVIQMIAVGDETGELDELMQEIAQMYEREVDYDLKTLASQIEPILIVVLGVIVLILALGVFLPMWDLGRVALRH